METSVMPSGKVPVLLIFWFTERWITELQILQVYKSVMSLWHHSCNSPAPNMFRVQSSTFIVVSCPSFGRHMWAWHEISSIKSPSWSLVYEELMEHIGGGVVTAVMSEVTSLLQGELGFANLQKSTKQKNCCLQLLFLWIRKSAQLEPYHI